MASPFTTAIEQSGFGSNVAAPAKAALWVISGVVGALIGMSVIPTVGQAFIGERFAFDTALVEQSLGAAGFFAGLLVVLSVAFFFERRQSSEHEVFTRPGLAFWGAMIPGVLFLLSWI